MRKPQSGRQRSRRVNPAPEPLIAHTIPTWQAKPGADVRALCGEWVHVPDGPVVRDALETEPDCIVCPLCECAAMLDGVPASPAKGWTQGEFFK